MGTSAVGTELSMMLSQLLGDAEIHDLHRLSGGASRETWRFTANGRALILQRQRSGDQRNMLVEAGVVGAARRGGVPVPELIDARRRDDGMAFMVLEAIDGESIARKIQRDDEFAAARPRLTADFGHALARIHALDLSQIDGLEATDQLTYYTDVLDFSGQSGEVDICALLLDSDESPAAWGAFFGSGSAPSTEDPDAELEPGALAATKEFGETTGSCDVTVLDNGPDDEINLADGAGCFVREVDAGRPVVWAMSSIMATD